MAIERWGSLSVRDHTDTHALIANVLLYDRLVMPMCTKADDRNERAYWKEKGWNPDLQDQRREELGDLVIECAWDKPRRESYSKRYLATKQMNQEVSGEMVTRWLLTEDQEKYSYPAGVHHADIFVAYHSEQESRTEINYQKLDEPNVKDETKVGILLAHELGIPQIEDSETALKEAMGLSRDGEFRKKREDLYSFQMTCLGRGMSPKAIVAELRDRNNELANYYKKQKIPVKKKAGFMLAQVCLGIIGGSFIHPLAAVGGLLSVWQFAALDASVDFSPSNRLTPVAAFYDMEHKLGTGCGKH